MKRFGALACLLLYCAANLPLTQGAASLWSRVHRPAAVSEAIAVPGPMSGGADHACCCKHAGSECEMGCCHASGAPAPGEACFKPCGGMPKPAAPAFTAESCLLPSHPGYLFRAVAAPVAGAATSSPSRSASEPADKVPIG